MIRQVVGRVAELLGFREEEKQGVMLAVNEGCANIIEHCYGMETGRQIDVTVREIGDGIRIDLRDYGEQQWGDRRWDDLQRGENRDAAIRECGGGDDEPRGLGIRLMKSVMDEVRWSPADRLGTRLTMVKRRSPGD